MKKTFFVYGILGFVCVLMFGFQNCAPQQSSINASNDSSLSYSDNVTVNMGATAGRPIPTAEDMSVKLDVYISYLDGNLASSTARISESDALANCQASSEKNLQYDIRCTWGAKDIFVRAKVAHLNAEDTK